MCALSIEADAVAALFDETWDDAALADKAPTDTNAYSLGVITTRGARRVPVVLVHLSRIGKVASATAAGGLRASFRHLRLVLLVGICGGAPRTSPKQSDELLLGDVVVNTGVVQYDLGRRFPGRFVRKDTPRDNLSRLSVEADSLLAKMQAKHGKEDLSDCVCRHLDTL
jgi:nucleoside phosphorylase